MKLRRVRSHKSLFHISFEVDCRRWGGFCNDWEGCLLPHNSLNDTCKLSQCVEGGWTPDGCLVPSIDNSTCTERNGTFLAKAQTRYECETKVAGHCFDPTLPGIFRQEMKPFLTNTPLGYSPIAERECSSCGRKFIPYFTWTPANWRSSGGWYPFSWRDRGVTRPYKWERVFNANKFFELFDAARTKRYAAIVKNELVCSYSYNFDAIEALACSCGDGERCASSSESPSSIRTVVLGTGSLCAGVADNVTLSNIQFQVPVRFHYLHH